jgi:hypothetical protein
MMIRFLHNSGRQNVFVCSLVFFYLLFASANLGATTVGISTKDRTGDPIANALVIIKSLETGREVVRVLSDKQGQIPEVDLHRGFYRVIATDPYGLWETKVQELLVTEERRDLSLFLDAKPTHDNVSFLGSRMQTVQVLDRNGKPVSELIVLAWNESAIYEKWYKTNEQGEANVQLA